MSKSGKTKRFGEWIEFRKLKIYLKKNYINPSSMFKLVNDYGYGDRSEYGPYTLKEALREFKKQNNRLNLEIGTCGFVFDRDSIHYIEECKYGWY